MQVLYDIVVDAIPIVSRDEANLKVYDVLKQQYGELCLRAKMTEIKSRFGYYKKIVEAKAADLKRDCGGD